MALSTVTASAAAQARLPRSVEKVHLQQTYNRSVSASDGDIFLFDNLKIPHGALITNVEVIHDTSDGQTIWEVGYYSNGISAPDQFGSITLSATQTIDTLMPLAGVAGFRVSVSDDAAQRFVYICARQDGAVGSSPTGSISVTIRVEYTMIRD